MSANIPETKLVSELLKPTGFNCPEDLTGKTFAEATSGGGDVELEDNKSAAINVTAYTSPVVVNPTEGKDAMKKVTVTLTNIPSGGTQFYIYHYEQGGDSLLCEASSFESITVGMKGVMSSAGSEYMTGVTCTEKTAESATFRNDTYSVLIASSDVPTSLSSILS